MEGDCQASQQEVDSVAAQLDKLDKFKEWAQTDVKARYEQLKQAVDPATERIITLMVIFLLQTLVFPVVLLGILGGFFRRLFEFSPPAPDWRTLRHHDERTR